MPLLILIVGNVATVLLAALGLAAGDDQVAAWAKWLGFLHDHDWATLGVLLLAAIVFALTWADALAEYKIGRAGGRSKKEFRANLAEWAKIESFPLGQAVWLWNGLKPNSEFSRDGTIVDPTYHRLEGALAGGALKDVHVGTSGWATTPLSRQQLVDLAISLGERPRFLFPGTRQRSMGFDAVDARSFQSIGMVTFLLMRKVKEKDPTRVLTSADASVELAKWLRAGTWEAIGRQRIDKILYPFERIPRRVWRSTTKWDFAAFGMGESGFEDVRVRAVTQAQR